MRSWLFFKFKQFSEKRKRMKTQDKQNLQSCLIGSASDYWDSSKSFNFSFLFLSSFSYWISLSFIFSWSEKRKGKKVNDHPRWKYGVSFGAQPNQWEYDIMLVIIYRVNTNIEKHHIFHTTIKLNWTNSYSFLSVQPKQQRIVYFHQKNGRERKDLVSNFDSVHHIESKNTTKYSSSYDSNVTPLLRTHHFICLFPLVPLVSEICLQA